LFGIDNRIECVVLNLQKLGRIVRHGRRFRHHCRYRLALVTNLGHRQRVIFDLGKGSGPISMKGWVCCAISGPVSVQTTPATASADEVSILMILAWAYGDRTNRR